MVVEGARLETGAGWRAAGALVCWGGVDDGGPPMGSGCWACARAAA